MKRTVLRNLLSLVAMTTLVFSACGGGSDSAETSAPTAVPDPTEVPTTPPDPTETPVPPTPTPEPTATPVPPTPTPVPPTPEPTEEPTAEPTAEPEPTEEAVEPTVEPTAEPTVAEAPATAPDGSAIFSSNCAFCHGPSGGGTGRGPSIVGIGQFFTTDASPLVGLVTNGGTNMPSFGARLTAAEIDAVVQYVVATFQ